MSRIRQRRWCSEAVATSETVSDIAYAETRVADAARHWLFLFSDGLKALIGVPLLQARPRTIRGLIFLDPSVALVEKRRFFRQQYPAAATQINLPITIFAPQ